MPNEVPASALQCHENSHDDIGSEMEKLFAMMLVNHDSSRAQSYRRPALDVQKNTLIAPPVRFVRKAKVDVKSTNIHAVSTVDQSGPHQSSIVCNTASSLSHTIKASGTSHAFDYDRILEALMLDDDQPCEISELPIHFNSQ